MDRKDRSLHTGWERSKGGLACGCPPPHGQPSAGRCGDRAVGDGRLRDRTILASGTWSSVMLRVGGYKGLERGGDRYDRQLQFSVWDVPGYGDAGLIEEASDVAWHTFGGEGTGMMCALDYRWTVTSAYHFEVTEGEMNGRSAITLLVTDLAKGSKRFVGAKRFARRAQIRSFGGFV